MAWGWRGRGGGWARPYPGRGPFSYLPPWQRPGWLFGFGRCWWGYPYITYGFAPGFPRLLRWWWAYPQYWYGPPYTGYGWGYWYPMQLIPLGLFQGHIWDTGEGAD